MVQPQSTQTGSSSGTAKLGRAGANGAGEGCDRAAGTGSCIAQPTRLGGATHRPAAAWAGWLIGLLYHMAVQQQHQQLAVLLQGRATAMHGHAGANLGSSGHTPQMQQHVLEQQRQQHWAATAAGARVQQPLNVRMQQQHLVQRWQLQQQLL